MYIRDYNGAVNKIHVTFCICMFAWNDVGEDAYGIHTFVLVIFLVFFDDKLQVLSFYFILSSSKFKITTTKCYVFFIDK